MRTSYEFPRPALTVDCVIFGFDEGDLKVLLIERGLEPFHGRWALPGGFVRVDESLDAAALRELEEETGVRDVYLEQLYTFGTVDRDPRERVVTVAYYALLKMESHVLKASADAARARWFSVREAPTLAFDHDEILATAIRRLEAKVRYEPIGFELLPEKFTLTQLQHLYETVLQKELDKRNFRKKILSMGLLIPLEEHQKNVRHRKARLYRFDGEKYRQLKRAGFNFEL